MSDTHKSLGFGLVALLPIACCIGLPLIAAAGVSVAVAAWAGALALATLVLSATLVLLARSARRHTDRSPTDISGRGRS